MEVITTQVFNGVEFPYSQYFDHVDLMMRVNASGTTAVSATQLSGSDTSYKKIAVCHRVDASNYAVTLPIGALRYVEIYTDGSGNIEVFPPNGGTFLNGTTSVTVTNGASFRTVGPIVTGSPVWACILGA